MSRLVRSSLRVAVLTLLDLLCSFLSFRREVEPRYVVTHIGGPTEPVPQLFYETEGFFGRDNPRSKAALFGQLPRHEHAFADKLAEQPQGNLLDLLRVLSSEVAPQRGGNSHRPT